MKLLPRLAVIGLLLPAAAGCVKARAQTPAPPPPLATPDPPDRVIVPVTLPEPTEAAPQPAPPAQQAPRPQQNLGTRGPSPSAAVPPATTPPPTDPAPAQVLQTTLNPAELERQANALIGAAERDLGRTDPKLLNANGKAQYQSAQGFIAQAREALKIRNFVLAQAQAEKAAALASQLAR